MADVPHGFESACAGHGNVHDHHVGLRPSKEVVSRRRFACLADDAKSAQTFEQPSISLAHDRVVVDQQDLDRSVGGAAHQAAASGIVAATRTPRAARQIVKSPPNASTRSRIPLMPRPAVATIRAASPPPSSSTVSAMRSRALGDSSDAETHLARRAVLDGVGQAFLRNAIDA